MGLDEGVVARVHGPDVLPEPRSRHAERLRVLASTARVFAGVERAKRVHRTTAAHPVTILPEVL